MKQPFHTIVIGAGSGGLSVAVGLANFGKRVALVERGRIGGDCTNVGCIPSKTLIHLAKAFAVGTAPGLKTGADVLAAVRAKRDRLWREEEAWILEIENLEVIRGSGRIAGGRSVVVEPSGATPAERQLSAEHIVLATGSRPVIIDIEGLPEQRRHTNETIFDLEAPPKHLAVVGAGVIGCELAFAFRHLGSAVTVVELADRPLPAFEPEASELMVDRFREAGIALHVGARAHGWTEAQVSESTRNSASSGAIDSSGSDEAADNGGALHLDRERAGKATEISDVDAVLLAVGRAPNLDRVGLGAVGLQAGREGLRTNRFGRTDAPTVYAIGDANERSEFTHTANAQARRLNQKLAFPWLPLGREGEWPAAVFTDPEVASVGPTRAELNRRLPKEMIRTIRIDLADTDRGYTADIDRGFVLLHVMRLTGRILSATVAAPHAADMLPLLTQAVNRGPRIYGLANHVFAYPTLMEAVRKAADTFLFDTLGNLPNELWHYAQHRCRRPAANDPA